MKLTLDVLAMRNAYMEHVNSFAMKQPADIKLSVKLKTTMLFVNVQEDMWGIRISFVRKVRMLFLT